MSRPRLLAVMGSGETTPTMVKVHRGLLDRLGGDATAVLLDTPFGFQMNAADLTRRAVDYFRQSVGHEMTVASFRKATDDALEVDTLVARLREASYVFAGPGSPSYALRQWKGTPVPGVLAEKLERGGCVTFASAAALTLGAATVPVYEVYKVGEPPRWLRGLDLLAATGLHAAVIPHYDNAEGGTHDTRFCYLGEERLALLERDLPEGAFVLGVDEHTACILDLDDRTATVTGRGAITVRAAGRSVTFADGDVVAIDELAAVAERLRRGESTAAAPGAVATEAGRHSVSATATAAAEPSHPATPTTSPLLDAVAAHENRFADALQGRDVAGAVRAVLDLEAELRGWAADSLQSDEMDRARATMRSMIVRLGELAETGARDPADALGPFVEALLDLRAGARDDRRWADADAVRDRLIALGVEVHDTPAGTTWALR